MQTPPEIRLGQCRIIFLTDGFWYNDGGCMFGVVPRPLWQRHHPADAHNRVRLNLTCPLIVRGREAALIDCGIGNRLDDVERRIFAHGEGWLQDGLKAVGMEPGDVTHVILSHLHFDHCGGLVRRNRAGVLEAAFPRARCFVQRGEMELAQGTTNERLRAAYRHVAECLAPLRERIELLDGDSPILAGLETRVTGGHTPGHQMAMVREAEESFLHLADLVPTRSHLRTAWNQAYDLEPLVTMERKVEYLEMAWAGRWRISFAHDDRIFSARLARESGRWELIEAVAVEEREVEEGG